MSRLRLERRQVWVYLAAVALGLLAGTAWPSLARAAETLVWPVLGCLLYVTFTQMPLASLPQAFRDRRFLVTALLGNFVVLPVVVWGLLRFVPDEPALRLGLMLVLLVPCTDWFISFSQLGRGDAVRATALTPIMLLLQLLLLPLYLWLMAAVDLSSLFAFAEVWPALLVLSVPLGLALVTRGWAERRPDRSRLVDGLGGWPVPLLALVVLLVATAHAAAAGDSLHLLPAVAAVAVGFLMVGLLVAKLLGWTVRLPVAQGRSLAFSLGTRNSFIVLPIALSLPAGWEGAAVVVVMQSLVELLGMAFYLWFVPAVLFPDRRPTPGVGPQDVGQSSSVGGGSVG